MLKRCLLLRRAARSVVAADRRFVKIARKRRRAVRTLTWKDDGFRVSDASVDQGTNNLRDHIARAADNDLITDSNIEASHFVNIVQRGITDRNAPYKYRLETGNGCNRSGPSYLVVNAQEPRDLLLSWKFSGNRPPRCTRNKTQTLLLREVVDLHDHTVNINVHCIALN